MTGRRARSARQPEVAICLYVLGDVVTFATEDGEFIGETRLDPNREYQPKGDGFRR
jgi:hypothetical protein